MRFQLFWQFIAETALITLLATIIAYCLAQQALPFVNQLLEMRMTISFSADSWLTAFLVILLVLATVGTVAMFYMYRRQLTK